jgi:NADPH:quinone reductase-like Zn-dependent oxidoreductase
MKAVMCEKYGSADVLCIMDVPKPEPQDNEVLIKIHESLATPSDVASRKGEPAMIRLFSGLTRPKSILGTDLAGEVEAIGKDVTTFKTGDRVFGATSPNSAANAQYVCLPEDGVLAKVPDGLPYEATAGFCDAAMTALSFLRDTANVQSGQKVLINGASGAIGTFAIQLAKHFNAEVTGVCSIANIELVKSLGADHVIDYKKQDFTQESEAYDIIFDAVGKSSFSASKNALKSGGIYMTTVPDLAILLQMLWTGLFGSKKAKFAATGLSQTREKLDFLKELLAAGKLKSIIDRRYPLDRIADAHRYIETGHKKGNIVITVSHT